MADLTHGEAQDLLDTYKRGWEERRPGVIVDLFSEDADYRVEPFTETLVGANAIRALLNATLAEQAHVEFDAERIWVSGSTILASWHAAYTRRASAERVRASGFMTMELIREDDTWRVRRFRQWPIERVVGRDASFRAEGGSE